MSQPLNSREQQSLRNLAKDPHVSPMIRATAQRRLQAEKVHNLAMHGIHNLHAA